MNQRHRQFRQRGPRTERAPDSPYLGLARGLAIVASVGIGFASFWGLRSVLAAHGGLSSWLVPLAFAVALTALLAGAWHMLLGLGARRRGDTAGLSLVIGMGVALTAVQIATSSWFLATAVGGAAAVQHHQMLTLEHYDLAAADAMQRNAHARQIGDRVAQARSEMEQLSRCEVVTGCVSGVPTRGPVVRELERAVENLAMLERRAAGSVERRAAEVAFAMDGIAAARTAARDGDEDAFTKHIAAASAALVAARETSAGAMVTALPSNSAWEAVRDVYRRLKAATSHPAMSKPMPAMPGYVPMDAASATIAYAEAVSFAWGVAIAVDALPLALLLILILAAHGGDRPRAWQTRRW